MDKWTHTTLFDRPYPPEKRAEGLAISQAIVGGYCDECVFLTKCITQRTFKFPASAWCIPYRAKPAKHYTAISAFCAAECVHFDGRAGVSNSEVIGPSKVLCIRNWYAGIDSFLLLPNKVVIVINLVAGITVVIYIVRLWDVVAVVI